MRHYPVYLDLRDKSCLVVGAGRVGVRKISTLLGCGVKRLLAVDPGAPSQSLAALLDHPALTHERRAFKPDDLKGMFLVIASTDNADLNRSISRLCQERNIMCNIVDQPELCNCILPAVLTRGDLAIAVSTGGTSPALAKKIRQRLSRAFGQEYADFLDLMGRLRPLVIGLGRGADVNADIFRSLTDDAILQAVKDRDTDRLASLLRQRLPRDLHPKLGALCDDLPHPA